MMYAMLPQLKLKPSRLPAWMQYLLMVLAGAGSFYAAMQLGPEPAPSDGGVELRKPSASVSIPVSTELFLPDVQLRMTPSLAPIVNPSVAASRMDAGLLQNPFGPLNPMVTVESLAKPIPPVPAEVKVTVKRPPKKVEAPPPPVIVQAPVAPPDPVAPPLPYRVLGSIQGSRLGDGAPIVFLSDRGNTLAVRAGDEIDKTYRVERISADKIEFIYLPLKTPQSLPISH